VTCPDLDTIHLHLDGELGIADEREVAVHVAACGRCSDEAAQIRSLERALEDGTAWGKQAATASKQTCVLGEDLLAALAPDASVPAHVQAHITRCSACQAELAGLSDVILKHERSLLDAPSAGLKAKLRRLAPQTASTVEEMRPARQTASRQVTRASGTGRTSATHRSARTSGTQRTSGARTSGRESKKDSRRTSRRTGRLQRLGAGAWGPAWAWGVMSAAAVVLVSMALALRAPEGTRLDVARAPRTPELPAVRTPDRRAEPARDSAPRLGPSAFDRVTGLPQDAVPPDAPAVEPQDEPIASLPTDVREVEPTPFTPKGVEPRAPTVTRDPEPATEVAAGPRNPSTGSEVAEPIADDGGRLELALGRLSGALSLSPADGNGGWQGLSRADGVVTLRPGDRIKSSSKAGAFVSLDGGAYEVSLDQGTEVVVKAARGGPVLGLDRGRVLAEVASLGPDGRFVVATRHGDFAVHGTVFSVEAGTEGAALIVAEGTVEARNASGQAAVSAGYGLALVQNVAPGAPAAVDVERGLSWANGLRPRREVIYAAHMDDQRQLAGFAGALSGEHDARGQALVMGPLTDNRYWGMGAIAPEHRIRQFRASADTFVSFSVWTERATDVLLELPNQTQGGKPFKKAFDGVAAGKWKTFTVGLMELQTYFDPGKNPVRESDTFNGLSIYAGPPGEEFTVLIDEVVVYRKIYR
jgi:hypothetical protein